MLKHRLLTAAVLIPLVVGGIFYFSKDWFAIFIGLFASIGAWEWARLAGVRHMLARTAYVGLFFCLIIGVWRFESAFNPFLITVLCCVWWLASLPVLFGFHNTGRVRVGVSPIILLSGFLLLLSTWIGLTQIRDGWESGSAWLLVLFVLIWGADSGAYFAGRKWGRHKLAPQLSPGKTWEGVAGAVVTTLAIAAVASFYLELSGTTLLALWFGLALLTLVFSIIGDLMESMIKRLAGVKDSGSLFPGHGGVLDRIDSLLAATPFFYVGWTIVQTPR